MYEHFKRQTSEISHEKTWTWLRKRNLERETESLLKAAQNTTTGSNYVKARIDQTQQNSICRSCGDWDETINHIISECSKLAHREYKTRYDWVGTVTHWKLCKKFNFDQKNKWYMPNPESVLENETHRIFWDFEIQTNHLISARRSDLVTVNQKKKKEKLSNNGLCRSGWPQGKTEGSRKER